jgi:hypothetical protein
MRESRKGAAVKKAYATPKKSRLLWAIARVIKKSAKCHACHPANRQYMMSGAQSAMAFPRTFNTHGSRPPFHPTLTLQ